MFITYFRNKNALDTSLAFEKPPMSTDDIFQNEYNNKVWRAERIGKKSANSYRGKTKKQPASKLLAKENNFQKKKGFQHLVRCCNKLQEPEEVETQVFKTKERKEKETKERKAYIEHDCDCDSECSCSK